MRQPKTRPHLPRISSSESGFFFCGIRLDPLVTPSPSSSQPNSSLEYRIQSSASRLRWSMVDAGGIEEVEREIAVAGDVHAVARDGVEAEVARDGLAVEGKAAAGQRARAERQHVGAARGPRRSRSQSRANISKYASR